MCSLVTIPGEGITARMQHSFIDGRLFLVRAREEREPLLQRLRKIEGRVRGLLLAFVSPRAKAGMG